ncbi:haloacid dehalogenase superfamily subfamily -2-like had subfamily ia [Leptolyngbya sp. Heron Island J]|uniref:HAD-IA family hydrolase n=1 Tax=Leptolyngbya sp. Heron Island J TaxID=1385935 RepID=UPI0003B9CBFA|nr:HAD-IA family hydrolase [Leptolyngbya sp. Heron Island J]ESA36260.1 haloacid dehalogenase superfamily subfamily -2-like had subfamily ia [Leptolyngbya sp. Heron Island J]
MATPKVIFLDAVGTLFGVKGSVGEVYQTLSQQAGVNASAQDLDKAFYRSFAAADAMAFPDIPPVEIPHCEYLWWLAIAKDTFQRAGILQEFSDFESFFEGVYQHFATSAPWVVYQDTLSSLKRWQHMDISLGIISNFDSRIYAVLDALDLRQYFQTITISTEAGAAKPDPFIFKTALQKHSCSAQEAWHVGDSRKDDLKGAQAAGLRGIWLKRTNQTKIQSPLLP